MKEWMREIKIEWMNERKKEWKKEWMNEWKKKERMKEIKKEWKKERKKERKQSTRHSNAVRHSIQHHHPTNPPAVHHHHIFSDYVIYASTRNSSCVLFLSWYIWCEKHEAGRCHAYGVIFCFIFLETPHNVFTSLRLSTQCGQETTELQRLGNT